MRMKEIEIDNVNSVSLEGNPNPLASAFSKQAVMSIDVDFIRQQFASVNDTLHTIQESNSALYKKVTDLQIHMKNLEGAVIGNAELGFDGLVKRVKALEDFKESATKLKAQFIGGSVVIGVVWTILLQFMQKLLQ
jgi:hypothetical protein